MLDFIVLESIIFFHLAFEIPKIADCGWLTIGVKLVPPIPPWFEIVKVLPAIRVGVILPFLVKSTILHGKLFEVVKQAEDPKSDQGMEISKIEKKEIMEAIKNLEDKIMKIKITVDQK